MKPEDERAERLARIRARRGTPEREDHIRKLEHEEVLRIAAAQRAAAADKAWERRFNRADLRTQALMLAEALGSEDDPLAQLMRQAADTLPPGVR